MQNIDIYTVYFYIHLVMRPHVVVAELGGTSSNSSSLLKLFMNAQRADIGDVVGLYPTYVFSDLRFCHKL